VLLLRQASARARCRRSSLLARPLAVLAAMFLGPPGRAQRTTTDGGGRAWRWRLYQFFISEARGRRAATQLRAARSARAGGSCRRRTGRGAVF